jgi:hypothetical protein
MKYTFKHVNGDETTVEATDETKARHRAMTKRYGPAGRDAVVPYSPYVGKGLTLVLK